MNFSADLVLSSYKVLLSRNAADPNAAFLVPRFQVKTLLDLTDEAIKVLNNAKPLIKINDDVVIVGDIHGNLPDLLRIFNYFGLPPKTKYLFLGDYVDRGSFSLNCISLLLAFLCKYPESVFLIRGNHETRSVNSKYGFQKEIMDTYDSFELWEKFNDVFDYLPLAGLLQNKYFCVHGGLSPTLKHIDDLMNVQLPLKEIDNQTMDLLWSDPCNGLSCFDANERGRGCQFGYAAVRDFAHENKITKVIRGHQCVFRGVEVSLCELVVTVFSSSYYTPNGNKCAALILKAGKLGSHEFEDIVPITREDACFYDVVPAKENEENSGSPLTSSRQLPKPIVTFIRRMSSYAQASTTNKNSVIRRPSLINPQPLRRSTNVKINPIRVIISPQ